MHEYISLSDIEELEGSDFPPSRHAAEEIKYLAAELLLAKTRELGLRYLQNASAPELPRLLWQAVAEGPEVITELEVAELAALSTLSGGWWRPNHIEIQEHVPLKQWEEEYEETLRV